MVVTLVDADEAWQHRDGVLRVWQQAFGPVEDEAGWVGTVWERHRARPDYRLALAHDESDLIGFAWGYTGDLGQYWPDLVSRALGAAGAAWVGGHFEFVELAVSPDARGRGIGGALHDRLLLGLPHRRALLGTSDDPQDPAVRLYLSRGWRPLGRLSSTAQVMGMTLPGGREGDFASDS